MKEIEELLSSGRDALQALRDEKKRIKEQASDEQFIRLTNSGIWETVAVVDVFKEITCLNCGNKFIVYAGIMVKQENKQEKATRWFWPSKETISYLGLKKEKRSYYSTIIESVASCSHCTDFKRYAQYITLPRVGKQSEVPRENSKQNDNAAGKFSSENG